MTPSRFIVSILGYKSLLASGDALFCSACLTFRKKTLHTRIEGNKGEDINYTRAADASLPVIGSNSRAYLRMPLLYGAQSYDCGSVNDPTPAIQNSTPYRDRTPAKADLASVHNPCGHRWCESPNPATVRDLYIFPIGVTLKRESDGSEVVFPRETIDDDLPISFSGE